MKEIIVLQEDRETGAGLLAEAADRRGVKVIIVEAARGDRVPKVLPDGAGLLVAGAQLAAPDLDLCPYIGRWISLIRWAAGAGRPVLAVGTGAHVAARALGASVRPAREAEAGWGTVTLTEAGLADRLFAGLPVYLPVFHWHSDEFDLPAGAVLLAGSPASPNQAFRRGENLHALQFHLGATEGMIRSWTVEGLGPGHPTLTGRSHFEDPFLDREAVARRAERLIENFLELHA
jgi:GMP synthase-like glutamine amidotransferase